MNIQTAIEKVLNAIPSITNKVFKLNAPKPTETPYVIYSMSSNTPEYILDGTTGNYTVDFDINVFSKDRFTHADIADEIRETLLNLLGTNLGGFLIQKSQVDINEVYESNIDLYRSIISLQIYI